MDRRAALLLLLTLGALPPALADTVVLTNGKRIEDVVVNVNNGTLVVINPWRSRHPEMTWEIPDKNRLPGERVREVIIADPPRVEYRRRASMPERTVADHLELAAFCLEHKLKAEREMELLRVLCVDPENAELRKEVGESRWRNWSRGNPLAIGELHELERAYLRAEDEGDLEELWDKMQKLGTQRKLAWLERARRSSKLPKGRRDEVPVTLRSRELEGATYCLFVSSKYDPLRPTALVLGLHGGGPGGRDRNLVTGSGESAMNFYEQLAEAWGWVCVCPSALVAGWGAKENEVLIDAVLDEMRMLFNIDENRIYLTGHSMGGFGAWHWGPRKADVWAAFAPCAGGGGSAGGWTKDLPVYIYHGSDDRIVGPDWDRNVAKSLLSDRKRPDFVYTELDGVGHGFPGEVRKDIFDFFAGRWKDKGRKVAVEPRSSFDAKPSREEIKAFGDPSRLPEVEEDASIKELIAALAQGGGGAAAAAEQLAQRKEESTVKSVSRVLRSGKTPADGRALAARVLGRIGLASCLKPLARATKDEDYRVVEAAAWALGETRLPEAAEHLARAGRELGEFWKGSFFGNRINFTEYEVRLGSFVVLVEALQKAGDAATALPVLEAEVVERVFAPAEPYEVMGSQDPRFRHVAPNARLALARALRTCLVTLKDPRGADLLRRIAANWQGESRLVSEAEAGIEELGS